MTNRDAGRGGPMLLTLAVAVVAILPIAHAAQTTSCVQHDALGRVVSKGGAPLTCAGRCGTVPDGCGGTLSCGACCTPATCAGKCGTVADGCGGTLACGGCSTTGMVCNPSTSTCCTPATCAAYAGQCGTFADGCGGTLACGCGAGACVAGRCSGTCDVQCEATCDRVVTNACSAGFTPKATCQVNARTGDCTGVGTCTCQ